MFFRARSPGTKRDRDKAIEHATESRTPGWNFGCQVMEGAKRAKK